MPDAQICRPGYKPVRRAYNGLASVNDSNHRYIDAARNVYRDLKSFDPTVQAATIDLTKTFNNTFTQKALTKYK